MARHGRRPGPNTTRAALLAAAQRHFASAGYEATSLRVIAADAGVDPAVVLHFFGSKAGLFRAAVGWPFDPATVAARLSASGTGDRGADLARIFLELWDDPSSGASLQAVLRSAMTDPGFAALLRAFITEQVFGQLRPLVDGPEADLRITMAAAQLVGIAVLRCVLAVEPLATAEQAAVVRRMTPVLNQYLGNTAVAEAQAAEAAEEGH